MRYVPRPDADNPNVSERAPLREFLQLAAGFLIVCVALSVGLILLGRFAVTRIGSEREEMFQDAMARVFKEQFDGGSTADPYLAGLIGKLQGGPEGNPARPRAGAAPIRRAHLMCDSEDPNAFAIPGRIVGITGSLVRKLTTEEGLAFVLAHELGHFHHRDHLQGLGQAFGTTILTVISHAAGLGGSLATLSEAITGGVRNTFSREQEENADAFAVGVLRATYGTPRGALEVMKVFDGLEKETGTHRVPVFLRTHPRSEERLREVERLVARGRVATGEATKSDLIPHEVKEEAFCRKAETTR